MEKSQKIKSRKYADVTNNECLKNQTTQMKNGQKT